MLHTILHSVLPASPYDHPLFDRSNPTCEEHGLSCCLKMRSNVTLLRSFPEPSSAAKAHAGLR